MSILTTLACPKLDHLACYAASQASLADGQLLEPLLCQAHVPSIVGSSLGCFSTDTTQACQRSRRRNAPSSARDNDDGEMQRLLTNKGFSPCGSADPHGQDEQGNAGQQQQCLVPGSAACCRSASTATASTSHEQRARCTATTVRSTATAVMDTRRAQHLGRTASEQRHGDMQALLPSSSAPASMAAALCCTQFQQDWRPGMQARAAWPSPRQRPSMMHSDCADSAQQRQQHPDNQQSRTSSTTGTSLAQTNAGGTASAHANGAFCATGATSSAPGAGPSHSPQAHLPADQPREEEVHAHVRAAAAAYDAAVAAARAHARAAALRYIADVQVKRAHANKMTATELKVCDKSYALMSWC